MLQSFLVAAIVIHLAVPRVPVAGCYTLSVGPWSLPRVSLRVPGFVQLRADTATDRVGMLSPDLMRSSPRKSFPGTPRWEREGDDVVTLIWSDGFTGVTLPLRIQGDTLRGIAHSVSDDMSAPTASAVVTGVRVECGSGTPK